MGRPGFKPGGRRHALPGGFDSHSLPPFTPGTRHARGRDRTPRTMSTIRGFEFPDDLHYLVDEDTWARIEPDGTVVVGLTPVGLALAGELYMCRVKSEGLLIEAHRAVAVVELAKSVMSVRAPVGGTVVGINEAAQDRPGHIVRDPYGAGWLARLRPASAQALAGDLARLVTGAALIDAMTRRIDREPPAALGLSA